MIGTFHIEPALAIVYSIVLTLIAAVLERLAKRSHNRAQHYRTGGFRFHRDRDAWECPIGIALIRTEIDQENHVVRYRAPAHTCNSCQIKSRCTNSDRGREIVVQLDPWVRSASLRLQRGISVVLLALASFILCVELFRHDHGVERYAMGIVLTFVLWRWLKVAGQTRAEKGQTTKSDGLPHTTLAGR